MIFQLAIAGCCSTKPVLQQQGFFLPLAVVTMPSAPFSVANILGKSSADPRLEELFSLDKQIGKGAFGVVRLARKKATGEPVAVKSISKAKLVCREDVKDVQAEVAIMNLVAGHVNVVTLEVGVGGHGAS